MAKLVSIVVPAFNAETYISETLESLLAQSYSPIEIIVVDDGSTDRTAGVVSRYSARGVRPVTQINQGQSQAVNKGWAISTGEFLGYLSADDLLYPQAIAELVEVFQADDTAVLVYPDYDLIDARSQKISAWKAPDFDFREMVVHSVCAPGPGALFRRSLFEKTGGWDTSLRQMPDFDFWLRCGKLGKFRHLKKVLAAFRNHTASQTYLPSSFEKSEEPVRVLLNYFNSQPLSLESQTWRPEAIAHAHVLAAALHARAGRWRQTAKHMRQSLALKTSLVLQFRFWRRLASGVLGSLRYRALRLIERRAVTSN